MAMVLVFLEVAIGQNWERWSLLGYVRKIFDLKQGTGFAFYSYMAQWFTLIIRVYLGSGGYVG